LIDGFFGWRTGKSKVVAIVVFFNLWVKDCNLQKACVDCFDVAQRARWRQKW
jgi:hypothetical protein